MSQIPEHHFAITITDWGCLSALYAVLDKLLQEVDVDEDLPTISDAIEHVLIAYVQQGKAK